MSFPALKPGGLRSFTARIGRAAGAAWNSLFRGNLLRVTFFSGLILLFLAGGTLAAVYIVGGGSKAEPGDSFYRLLREYDRAAERAGIPAAAGGAPVSRLGDGPETENLNRELDRLEKTAETAESWLSLLKRRRRLALANSRYMPAYRQSARRAREVYPWSEPLAALAAAAVIYDSAIPAAAEQEVRSCLSLLAASRFNSLRLSIHVLLGDMKSPAAADTLPPDLSAFDVQDSVSPAEREAVAANVAMARLMRGDSAGAAAGIQSVLGHPAGPARRAADSALSAQFLRFAAEYFYDFGDLSRSAELFSLLPDEAALFRQADALWLAGYAGSARAVWSMLAASGESGAADLGIRARCLYNLALTAASRDEAAALLEQLAALSLAEAGGGSGGQYGLIRYSRLLDAPRAVAVLEAAGGEADAALRDLEILRRRTEIAETGRLVAETWLLLGRYPDAENLYRWGAWFFDFRRSYDETAALLKAAARRGFSGQWIAAHEALRQLRNGNSDGAENLLESLAAGDWAAAANLGRIFESRHAPARALEMYEIAAAALQGTSAEPAGRDQAEELRRRETASRVQFRIARCLQTLGRAGESRRVLEYALDLDPDNLDARLELGRLSVP